MPFTSELLRLGFFGIVFATGLNRNLYFLGFLWSTLTFVHLALPRKGRARWVFLAIEGYLALVTPRLERLTLANYGGLGFGSVSLISGEEKLYRFHVADRLTRLADSCGTQWQHTLNIQGLQLNTLDLSLEGAELGRSTIRGHRAQDILSAPVAGVGPHPSLKIRIRPKEAGGAYLRTGPEQGTDGRVYDDAVYLVAENSRCRAVFHALRECAPTACLPSFSNSTQEVLE